MARTINIEQYIKDLKTDLVTLNSEISKDYAIWARERLYKKMRNKIQDFYDNYDPNYYDKKRHYYNLLDLSYKKYYSNRHGKTYAGGVELSPSFMIGIYDEPKRKVPTDYIFHSVIEEGMHGWVNSKTPNPPTMKRSPLELILAERDKMEKHAGLYVDSFIKNRIKKSHYKVLFH